MICVITFSRPSGSSTEEVLSRARRSQEAAAVALRAAQSSVSPPARDMGGLNGLKQPNGVGMDFHPQQLRDGYAGIETIAGAETFC
jgi:hypothetical protein